MGNFAYGERLKALIHNELSPTTHNNRARVAKGRKRTCQGIPRQEGDGVLECRRLWICNDGIDLSLLLLDAFLDSRNIVSVLNLVERRYAVWSVPLGKEWILM